VPFGKFLVTILVFCKQLRVIIATKMANFT